MRTTRHSAATRHRSIPATSALSEAIGQALHTPRIRHRASAALMLAALALAAPVAQAQSTEWVEPAPATGNWFNPANWSDGVPDASTDANIRNGGTVVIDNMPTPLPSQARNLLVEGGSGLYVFSGPLTTSSGVIGDTAGSSGTISVGTWLPGNSASWTNTGIMTIGGQGTGRLDIIGGSSVSNSNVVFIGREAGGLGTVTVDGAGTTLNSDDEIFVGEFGEGHLTVSGGAYVESGPDTAMIDTAGIRIGNEAGSNGSVTVTGAGSTLSMANDAYVGNRGTGSLQVLDGGTVINKHGLIGAFGADGVGSVLVDGAGSTWTSTGTLRVGYFGTGSMTVGNGGAVNSFDGYIGSDSGSQGTVLVDGPGSIWTSTLGIYVGYNGSGEMTIRNGCAVVSDGAGLGGQVGGAGTLTVEGAGSRWDTSFMNLGGFGTGTATLRDGGTVNSTTGDVGGFAFGGGLFAFEEGSVVVEGAGSSWNIADRLDVGRGHGTLTVRDGAALTSGEAVIGNFYSTRFDLVSGEEASVLIDGPGSTWTSTGRITVGLDGNGLLAVRNGGTVDSAGGTIGLNERSTEGAVVVEGAGSRWNNAGSLIVGADGAGALTVTDGGAVATSGLTRLGSSATGVGTMTVTGSGSTFDSTGQITVGGEGTGTMVVADGGAVSSVSGTLGSAAGSSGSATVDGAGSVWNMGDTLFVGLQGTGDLMVRNGGAVTSGATAIGQSAGSAGSVVVEGAGSSWSSTGFLSIGENGTGAFTVRDGATADNDGTTSLGNATGASGALTVTGAGSTFDSAGNLLLGSNGTGTMTVSDGGVVTSLGGTLALGIDGTGNVLVDGPGSAWTMTDNLRVAQGDGSTGSVVVRNGGALGSRSATVGLGPDSQGSVQIDGAGSAWINTAGMSIGANGDGTVAVTGGGRLQSSDAVIGAGSGQGRLQVSGAGSQAEMLQTMVGWMGNGELVVEDGGSVSSVNGFVGEFAGAQGTVRVDGAGSRWDVQSGPLDIGDRGAGTLTVTDGGTVAAAELFLARNAGSTGTLDIGEGGAAGVLDTASVTGGAGTATVNFNHSDDIVFDALLTGSLSGNQLGAGTTIFTADNDYSGLTTISDGTLQLGDDGNSGGVTGDIANDSLLVFNRGNTYDYSGAIGGSGDVHQMGSGILMLSGASSYSGETQVQAGTLLVEGSLGDTTTTVFDGATLGGTGTIAGDVIVHDGATLSPGTSPGTLTVGSLFLSEGSILDYELGQAGVIGSGINDLIEIGGDLTLDGTMNITDAGGFGAGVYRLMNYGGSFTDNGLDLGSLPTGFTSNDLFVQTAIVGQVNLINSAGVSLNFWDGAAGPADDSIIQGGDGVWVSNDRSWTNPDGSLNGNWNEGFAVFGGEAGTVTVMGEHAFTGMQFMTDGYRLEQGTDGALRASGTTNLRVDPNVTATIATPIVGDATLVKVDEGTLVLEGDFGYTGGVTVNGGRLVGDTGNLLGDILNRAELEFAQTDDDTYAGAISGEGTLIKSEDGTLVLTGANTYTGGTTIEAGTLQVGDGGTTGNIVGDVAIQADGTLAFDRSDSLSFAGAFSGDGTLDKLGAGTLWLTGNSSAYAGQATLHTGGLRVDGTLGGFLDVLAGTTLSGHGTLGSVDNAGTVAPDGTLSFSGDYVQREGSTYLVDIAPDGTGDLLDIVGTATIEGGEVFVVKAPGQYAGGSRYTIVDADGGVVGTYDALDQNLPFLDLILTYDPNHVYLDILRNDTEFGSLCGTGTFNQCEVAKTLDSFDPEVAPTADIGAMVEQVTGMDTATALAAFDRMSGEAHASIAGIVLEGHALYGQTVTRRMAERREALGADRLHGGAWVRGYGASSELDGDGNAHAADWDLRGLAVGYDAWGTEHWLIGASFNAMRLDADFRPGDKAEVDAKNVSLYISFQGERAYLDAVASYAWWDNEVTRAVEVGDIDRTATSEYGSHRFATYLEGGWTFNVGERSLLQPMLTLQYDNLASQAFREEGAQDLSLIGRSDSVERLTLGAGARWSTTFNRGDWTLEPTVQARWLHSEGDEYAEFDVAFSGAPDEGYRLPEFGWRVRGVTLPQDRGVIGLGLAARNDNLDLFVDYDYQTGDGFKAHNLGAGLRYRW